MSVGGSFLNPFELSQLCRIGVSIEKDPKRKNIFASARSTAAWDLKHLFPQYNTVDFTILIINKQAMFQNNS